MVNLGKYTYCFRGTTVITWRSRFTTCALQDAGTSLEPPTAALKHRCICRQGHLKKDALANLLRGFAADTSVTSDPSTENLSPWCFAF